MKSLYKLIYNADASTYVVAEDLNTACAIAERAAAELTGNKLNKVSSIEIIATEGRGAFNQALHIAPEAQPETTYDGPIKAGGLYS